MKNLFFFLLCPFLVVSQMQIGLDIVGLAAGEYSGWSVSLSNDGSIVAIGAPFQYTNNVESGYVRIYENQLGTWAQIGSAIEGAVNGDQSGYSVSLSSDGTVVAIGAIQNDDNGNLSGHVRVFENKLGVWTPIGAAIEGELAVDQSGGSVSLSSDGSVVAIGAGGNDDGGVNAGHVRVFMNDLGTWTKVGNDIDGEAAGDGSGGSVSLSGDGNIVAIGAALNDGNGNSAGHVRIFENQGGTWTQLGADLDGEAAFDNYGGSVSLSSDGSVVAIGGVFNSANASLSGHVRIYKYELSIWTQIGDAIYGEADLDQSGYAVSLSNDGNVVAISANGNDGNGADSGHVRIYKNQSNSWVQVGNDIDGQTAGDVLGWSVSLSGDGKTVAVGTPLNDNNGEDSGHVRIFDLSAALSIESFKQDDFSFYPNPVKDVLNINLNDGLELKQVNIYNLQGQYLFSSKTKRIDVKNLISGIYFIEVETNQGKSAKKIVVE